MRRWPVGLIGFSTGWITSCPGLKPGRAARFSARVFPVTVRQSPATKPFSRRYFKTAGVPPTCVQIGHHVFAARLQIGQIGNALADALEIVDGQLDVDGSGHRDQVQHGVGRASQGHHDHHRVLERLPGHDVAGLDVLFEKRADGLARAESIRRACPDLRPESTSCREASCPSPRWRRPSCWPCTFLRRPPHRDSFAARWRPVLRPRFCRRGIRRTTGRRK